MIETYEAKMSNLKEDCFNTKELLKKTVLERDLLQQEKQELGKSCKETFCSKKSKSLVSHAMRPFAAREARAW